MSSIWKGGTVAAFAGMAVAACAPPMTAQQRIVVKLVHASDNGTAIASQASRLAGVPVRYLAAVSGQWHALALQCEGTAACSGAVASMARASDVYDSVRIDSRARIAASAVPG